MGGTTSHYAWPYPVSSDAPDGASQIQSLADAADASLNDAVTPQSGAGSAAAATHFSINSFTYKVTGGITAFFMTVTYSGSTLTAASNGNITNTTVATLPFAPANIHFLRFKKNGGAWGDAHVDTAGLLVIEQFTPAAVISSGDTLTLRGLLATGAGV